MIEVERALEKVLSLVRGKIETEIVPIESATGRVLMEDVYAKENTPPFRRAAMDGYAVKSSDLKGASRENPIKLKITMKSFPGHPPSNKLKKGEACLISTGAVVPNGADAVVKVEDTERIGSEVLIFCEVEKNENVAPPGEDFKKGEKLLSKGTILDAPEIGMLARAGKRYVKVGKRPRVAIFSTGDEIVEPGVKKGKAQIYDSNSFMLYSLTALAGGIPHKLGIAKDDIRAVRTALKRAEKYDVVIFTGGVSMGETDYIRNVMLEMGVKEVFWKVAMKPGKPVFTGIKGKRIFFGLPGNPVSAFTSFLLFVRPCIQKMIGMNPQIEILNATITEPAKSSGKRTHFLRGIFWEENGNIYVKPLSFQGSGILKSLTLSNCFIIVPPRTELKSGDNVRIINFRNF